MNTLLLQLLLSGPMPPHPRPPPPPTPVIGRWAVILFADVDFRGQALHFNDSKTDLTADQFNDAASSFKVVIGAKVRFYEDTNFKGAYFTFNCPKPIGNVDQGAFCEVNNLVNDVQTGWLCNWRPGAEECQGWWNDRISSVEILGPADEHAPPGVLDSGHKR